MLLIMLFMSVPCLSAFAETEKTSGADPLVLGHGVGLFKVGPLLARDNFENLKNWVVQIQDRSGLSPAKVRARDNSLDCLLPGRGCTVWFKKKLKTRVTIMYEVLCPTPTPVIKGLQPRDINNFWLAADPGDPDQGLFDSARYTGKFGSYDKMQGYYASTGGGGAEKANLTTRFRRYPREVNDLPTEHLALNDKDGKREYLITPDKVMTVQLVAYDDVIQYIVNGKLNYQIARGDKIQVEGRDSDGKRIMHEAVYDLKRFPVYREGYFGFRMVGTHHIYRNFRVYTLVPDDGVKSDSTWSRASETAQQRAARLQWWNTARFGMFVHWGIYSVVGGEYKGRELPNSAEWMMNRGKIPIAEYARYAERFNPVKFDAKAFVGLAKEAGMKYLVITAKHHDGFSMFNSKCSPYNIVKATPFKRDIMKELADACQEQGIRFGFYYSQCQDWHHPGGMGNSWDKSIKRVSFDEYVREKARPEVRQLLTEYGPIAIFWWDTPRDMSKESFNSLHSLMGVQTGLITNDRLGKDHDKGDYKTFERRIPKNAPAETDWEVCMPISGSWGYKRSDTKFKSIPTLIRNLVDIASKGGNYLLNVSPTGNGTLLPQATERLKAIGRWMKTNSESIYGTTASPFATLDWGRCTKKVNADGALLYLHVFKWPEDGKLMVPGLKNKVQQAYLMADQKTLKTATADSGIVVFLPQKAPDDIDSVVALKVSGKLDIESVLPKPDKDGSLILSAGMAYIHNNEGTRDARVQEYNGILNIGYWTDEEAWLEWTFKIKRRGRYEVRAELAVEEEKSRFHLGLLGKLEAVEVSSTGGYKKYIKKSLGEITVDKAGTHVLQIKPDKKHWAPINLRKLELKSR